MADDQDVDAVEGEGERDPEKRGEEDAAQDGQDGVGKEEIDRRRTVLGGGVLVGVHVTTSMN
jgi:hypothetical protein